MAVLSPSVRVLVMSSPSLCVMCDNEFIAVFTARLYGYCISLMQILMTGKFMCSRLCLCMLSLIILHRLCLCM